jgi:uncharacterized membrane protein YtjA (UPF0391 family)
MFSWAAFFALIGVVSGLLGIYDAIQSGQTGTPHRIAPICFAVAVALIFGSMIFRPILTDSPSTTQTTSAQQTPDESIPPTSSPSDQSVPTPTATATPRPTPTPTTSSNSFVGPFTPTPDTSKPLPKLRQHWLGSSDHWSYTLTIQQQNSNGSLVALLYSSGSTSRCVGTLTHSVTDEADIALNCGDCTVSGYLLSDTYIFASIAPEPPDPRNPPDQVRFEWFNT